MGPFQSRNIQLYRERDESYILNPRKDLSIWHQLDYPVSSFPGSLKWTPRSGGWPPNCYINCSASSHSTAISWANSPRAKAKTLAQGLAHIFWLTTNGLHWGGEVREFISATLGGVWGTNEGKTEWKRHWDFGSARRLAVTVTRTLQPRECTKSTSEAFWTYPCLGPIPRLLFGGVQEST